MRRWPKRAWTGRRRRARSAPSRRSIASRAISLGSSGCTDGRCFRPVLCPGQAPGDRPVLLPEHTFGEQRKPARAFPGIDRP